MSAHVIARRRSRRARSPRARRENETLYAVIKTVSSSLDLDRVLGGIVEIATDATGCHACFIYFLEGERLVLRAASPQLLAASSASSSSASTRAGRLGRAHQDARVHPRATRWPTRA